MKISNRQGLTVDFLENGAVKSIEVNPIRINLKAGTLFSNPGTNIYLRHRSNPIEYHALTGPESTSSFQISGDQYVAEGEWLGIRYTCCLQLAAESFSWQWMIVLQNLSGREMELDLVYLQEVGLKPVNAGLINEYYVSQYQERIILDDEKYGSVICCRQNMKESTGYPWLMLACRNGAESGSTDGMQFYGKTYRETGIPEGLIQLSMGGNYAGESPVVTLQEKPFRLAEGAIHQSSFAGYYLEDHPAATATKDLERLSEIGWEERLEKGSLEMASQSTLKNLFNSASFLPVEDFLPPISDAISNDDVRHAETHNGRLLSYFYEHRHTILKSKEILTDRPHAHIMQAKAGFVPDENVMATTAFMFGVFNSHISQGNTNFNVLLSVCTSPFNQAPEAGQRIFVETEGKQYLLGVPSVFEMGLNHCRWIYKHQDFAFQVRTWTSKSAPQINTDFKVLKGDKVKIFITHDFDPLNKWKVFPGVDDKDYFALPEDETMIKSKFKNARFRIHMQGEPAFRAGGDELIFEDKMRHGSSLFVIEVEPAKEFCMSFIGEVGRESEFIKFTRTDDQFEKDCIAAWADWSRLSLNLTLESENPDISAIREILPWYGMNAMTHYLTPYGLEQFSGAAWGTRDVSQGPVDLLLNLGKYAEARQVLLTIFSNQDPDGGWPQWWMFDSYANIRSDSSHDDIYYWCLIALAKYVKTTGDTVFLDEVLPFYHEKGIDFAEKKTLSDHVDRLIRMIISSFIPGTSLVPFGGGDWNDSLQPVSKDLARRMISSWTVEMNYQAFIQYQSVYEMTGDSARLKRLRELCENIKSDFNKYLVKDYIVAGYGLVEDDGSISVMLHPADDKTGVSYSILPMERGILSRIFTKEQADFHLGLIGKHLKGPDGARLMDKPLRYKGGLQEIFQRAENSTFFGREIGLMYVHEHIRYAESLALMGKADEFIKALRQAIPVGYRDVVACSDLRQSNCYYSSSDVHFSTRYEADERYPEVIDGKWTLRGGWRVYSSGPGIYIGLIISKLLGIRIEAENVIIDPVLTKDMDGLSVYMTFLNKNVTFKYSVKEGHFSPKSIRVNGNDVPFTLEYTTYRDGGAVIPVPHLFSLLDQEENILDITI